MTSPTQPDDHWLPSKTTFPPQVVLFGAIPYPCGMVTGRNVIVSHDGPVHGGSHAQPSAPASTAAPATLLAVTTPFSEHGGLSGDGGGGEGGGDGCGGAGGVGGGGGPGCGAGPGGSSLLPEVSPLPGDLLQLGWWATAQRAPPGPRPPIAWNVHAPHWYGDAVPLFRPHAAQHSAAVAGALR